MKFTEEKLEQAVIELFESEHYTHISGEQIHKELPDVLLREDRGKKDLYIQLIDFGSLAGGTALPVPRCPKCWKQVSVVYRRLWSGEFREAILPGVLLNAR